MHRSQNCKLQFLLSQKTSQKASVKAANSLLHAHFQVSTARRYINSYGHCFCQFFNRLNPNSFHVLRCDVVHGMIHHTHANTDCEEEEEEEEAEVESPVVRRFVTAVVVTDKNTANTIKTVAELGKGGRRDYSHWRAWHLGFAVLQCSSNSYFQAIITIYNIYIYIYIYIIIYSHICLNYTCFSFTFFMSLDRQQTLPTDETLVYNYLVYV